MTAAPTYSPPFKIDGSHATLRYTDRRGKLQVRGGRRTFLYGRVYVDALLTGWGTGFEMQVTRGGPWHKLALPPEQAARQLGEHPLSRGRLRRLQARPDYVLRDKAA